MTPAAGAADARCGVCAHGVVHGVVGHGGVAPAVGAVGNAAGGHGGVLGDGVVAGARQGVAEVVAAGGDVGPGDGGLTARRTCAHGVNVLPRAGSVGTAARDATEHHPQSRENDARRAAAGAAVGVGHGVDGGEGAARHQRAVINGGAGGPGVKAAVADAGKRATAGHGVVYPHLAAGDGGGVVVHIVAAGDAVLITGAAHIGIAVGGLQTGVAITRHHAISAPAHTGPAAEGARAALQLHGRTVSGRHARESVGAVGPGDSGAGERAVVGGVVGSGKGKARGGGHVAGQREGGSGVVARHVITGGAGGAGVDVAHVGGVGDLIGAGGVVETAAGERGRRGHVHVIHATDGVRRGDGGGPGHRRTGVVVILRAARGIGIGPGVAVAAEGTGGIGAIHLQPGVVEVRLVVHVVKSPDGPHVTTLGGEVGGVVVITVAAALPGRVDVGVACPSAAVAAAGKGGVNAPQFGGETVKARRTVGVTGCPGRLAAVGVIPHAIVAPIGAGVVVVVVAPAAGPLHPGAAHRRASVVAVKSVAVVPVGIVRYPLTTAAAFPAWAAAPAEVGGGAGLNPVVVVISGAGVGAAAAHFPPLPQVARAKTANGGVVHPILIVNEPAVVVVHVGPQAHGVARRIVAVPAAVRAVGVDVPAAPGVVPPDGVQHRVVGQGRAQQPQQRHGKNTQHQQLFSGFLQKTTLSAHGL